MTTPAHFFPPLDTRQAAEVTRLIGEIDEFKGHWRKLGDIQQERLARLRQVTTIESAGSSTRIEGAQLTDDEVARVLQGLKVDRFRERDEAEVLGYGELLQTIFDHYDAIPLTENYIRQLHQIMLGHVEKDAWHRGHYKRLDNHVQATHPDGRSEIIFRTASPFDTPRRMTALVVATNEAIGAGEVHPLICIARFIVEFLAIHPFQDGNGRLSRALTALLLLRSGYTYVPYGSIERVVEDNKAEYYRALRASQASMDADATRFAPWLLFFLRVLQAQKRGLAAKLDVERSIVRLSDTQQRVLAFVERHGTARTPEIAAALGLPDRSVRYHLAMLVRRNLLEAHGERRGRYYKRAMGTSQEALASGLESRNAAILATILDQGGSIGASALRKLLREHGMDARMAGALHGRRQAHLRRDKNGRSVLTARGHELAEQYLFAKRLSRNL